MLVLSFVGISRERDRALAESQRTLLVSELLIDLLELPDPVRAVAFNRFAASHISEKAAFLVDGDLKDDPELRVAFLIAVGRVTRNLGDLERAWQLFESARAAEPPADRPDLSLELNYRVAELAIGTDRFDEAWTAIEAMGTLAPSSSFEPVWRARSLALEAMWLDKMGKGGALEAIERGLEWIDGEQEPLVTS